MVARRQQRILIAEDDPDLALTLAKLLKFTGFKVSIVHDGHAAIAAAKSRKPDILLLDINLPGPDGLQVARAFRADAELKDIVIIATSAYSKDTLQAYPQPGDFDHYFVKPFDLSALLRLLQ